ncbi:hypothetical protein KC968_03670 [Candidatus Saccharibacteria bacterium]|nr:hypothetical protein [Candidatus Saccharibacteria bacterium]
MIQVRQAVNYSDSSSSKAEDFQPLTQNPQTTDGGLQPVVGPQDAVGQDILNQKDAHILVPTSDHAPTVDQPSIASGAQINWLIVVSVSVIIVVAIEFVLRKREKNKSIKSSLHNKSNTPIIGKTNEE